MKTLIVRWNPTSAIGGQFVRQLQRYDGGQWRSITDAEVKAHLALQLPVVMNPSKHTFQRYHASAA